MRCIAYRTLLNGRRRTRSANNEVSTPVTVSHTADERAQHFLRHFIIEDGARANRPMHFNAARLATEQPQRFVTDRNDFPVISVDGHDRRLIQNHTTIRLIDERVNSAQIYS